MQQEQLPRQEDIFPLDADSMATPRQVGIGQKPTKNITVDGNKLLPVRYFLMVLTDVDVSKVDSIRMFADAYKELYIEETGKQPVIDTVTGYLLYPISFMVKHTLRVRSRISNRMFNAAFLMVTT